MKELFLLAAGIFAAAFGGTIAGVWVASKALRIGPIRIEMGISKDPPPPEPWQKQ